MTEIETEIVEEQAGISQWEFVERIPTREETLGLLRRLAPVWGVETVDFADYVQALPQKKKVKRPHPENPAVLVDEYLNCYVLYMSVAGREMMLARAAQQNGWQVDFEPEPFTATGTPGFLSDGSSEANRRIVYREYCVVHDIARMGDKDGTVLLGRKPGMAWVPYSGGSQAAGSNPYEKVETAARGRAIAAWGFGVLPGSGVASVEEIMGSTENRAAIDAEQTGQPSGRTRKSRADLLTEAMTVAEEVRQRRGQSEEDMRGNMVAFLQNRLGIAEPRNPETEEIDWSKVKDGQITLLTNSLRDSLRRLNDAESEV